MNALSVVRTRLSRELFSFVAGEDGEAARHRIHGTPGPRWFAPDSPIRRVHGDTSMYVGGLRALLLQALHPLAMAAVADHSGYQSDPWGRLARTSTFIAETTFGTVPDAERAVARVRTVHSHISGVASDGRPYRADDPHLLAWVHVAEIDSFLRAHQRYGRRPLTPAEADTYVAQTAKVARLLGATDVPMSRAELDDSLEAFRPELAGTPEAREVARFLLRDAPLSARARLPYASVSAAAVGLLPHWARQPLRLPHLPLAERTVVPVMGGCVVRGLRWVVNAQPVPTADEGAPA